MSSMTACRHNRPRSQRSAIGRLYANCKEGRDRRLPWAMPQELPPRQGLRYASCRRMPMGHTAKINGRHASGWRWSGVAKFGKVLVVAQLMSRMVGDALAAQAEGAQHRWQGAASPQGGARKGAGHRSAQPQQKPACFYITYLLSSIWHT